MEWMAGDRVMGMLSIGSSGEDVSICGTVREVSAVVTVEWDEPEE